MSESESQQAPSGYVRYRDDVEAVELDEAEVIEKLIAAMLEGMALTRPKHGRTVRAAHAKAHGLVKGELRVLEGLPAHLRQGLFAQARTYPVVARLSHVPGDLDDDRRVSGPRGMALKVLGVDGLGPMLPGHAGETTQDLLLDTGKVFNAVGPKAFLAQIAPVEHLAPRTPQAVKGVVSAVSLATNTGLGTVGAHSAVLDFFGHPFLHPLGEPYYSQAPLRYGDFIAKLNVVPDSPGLQALKDAKLDVRDFDGLRQAVVAFFREHPAEFVMGVQLCTDLTRMPVENANAEWPESESPYQPVARLVLPAQDAYDPALQDAVDEAMLFSPSHSLAAHRPLGGIMRARMAVYEAVGRARREQNGQPVKEPRGADDLP
ncbi:catalase family protein [Corallococcus macrosporus]|uniref:Catalase family protein n=1 Tax=Corallococcus macrosporus TaxID=35 RepID=A0ABS3DA17_9BACT|nr:catalase family protein [Corallococcus macrosporus]MBN8228533.1 catalase family protein [Corallococcus macrosporus]